jgi:hypothetical protein
LSITFKWVFRRQFLKLPAVQLPLRLLFWCKDDPLHEGKASGYTKDMNKGAGSKNKNAKYPGHNQQCCYNKKGKFHVAFFNFYNLPFKTCPFNMDGVTAYFILSLMFV